MYIHMIIIYLNISQPVQNFIMLQVKQLKSLSFTSNNRYISKRLHHRLSYQLTLYSGYLYYYGNHRDHAHDNAQSALYNPFTD